MQDHVSRLVGLDDFEGRNVVEVSGCATCRSLAASPANRGVDSSDGGDGDDRFHTRDGEVDTITCGAGHYVVRADQFDRFADRAACERAVIVPVTRLGGGDPDDQERRFEDPQADKDEG